MSSDGSTEHVGCALRSRQAGEDIAGTASTVRRWILVEQPGPWGADALRQSRLDADVAAHLHAVGRQTRARVLLIRRCGRDSEPAVRSAFAAVTTTTATWVERVPFASPAELVERDWAPLADDRSVGGEPHHEPLFLVCTNGRHDACCAALGRPVALALAEIEPEATWEASHFGGDRFAGNVVCLPGGLYYGRLGPADAGALAAATRQRRLLLPHFRGRSSLAFGVQAAEIALRRRLDLDGMEDLVLAARRRVGEHAIHATFRDREAVDHVVAVTIHHDAEPAALSCGAGPLVPPRFETHILTPSS